MSKVASKFCWSCEAKKLHAASGPNHILHLILSVLTLGAWLIVWSWCAAFSGGYRCQTCGEKYSWMRSRTVKKL